LLFFPVSCLLPPGARSPPPRQSTRGSPATSPPTAGDHPLPPGDGQRK
jgi:hypothetical protein